jgi:hypothetical protein
MAEEKKDDKAKDADVEKKDEPKKEEKASDASAYDEMLKIVKDLGEKISAMQKPKDESTKAEADEPAKIDAKDDEQGGSSLEDRLKSLEAAVAKLLEKKAEAGDDDESEMESEDAEEGEEESKDDDFEESTMTGDTASRVEILAPGLDAKAKDAKAKALKAAYETKDGKAVIDQLTGGKAPELKDEARVNTLFIAASELLKVSRTSELSKTKQTRDFDSTVAASKGAMTAEQMNAINAKHYASK